MNSNWNVILVVGDSDVRRTSVDVREQGIDLDFAACLIMVKEPTARKELSLWVPDDELGLFETVRIDMNDVLFVLFLPHDSSLAVNRGDHLDVLVARVRRNHSIRDLDLDVLGAHDKGNARRMLCCDCCVVCLRFRKMIMSDTNCRRRRCSSLEHSDNTITAAHSD